jgi:hypothetical protein
MMRTAAHLFLQHIIPALPIQVMITSQSNPSRRGNHRTTRLAELLPSSNSGNTEHRISARFVLSGFYEVPFPEQKTPIIMIVRLDKK